MSDKSVKRTLLASRFAAPVLIIACAIASLYGAKCKTTTHHNEHGNPIKGGDGVRIEQRVAPQTMQFVGSDGQVYTQQFNMKQVQEGVILYGDKRMPAFLEQMRQASRTSDASIVLHQDQKGTVFAAQGGIWYNNAKGETMKVMMPETVNEQQGLTPAPVVYYNGGCER